MSWKSFNSEWRSPSLFCFSSQPAPLTTREKCLPNRRQRRIKQSMKDSKRDSTPAKPWLRLMWVNSYHGAPISNHSFNKLTITQINGKRVTREEIKNIVAAREEECLNAVYNAVKYVVSRINLSNIENWEIFLLEKVNSILWRFNQYFFRNSFTSSEKARKKWYTINICRALYKILFQKKRIADEFRKKIYRKVSKTEKYGKKGGGGAFFAALLANTSIAQDLEKSISGHVFPAVNRLIDAGTTKLEKMMQ